MDESKEKKGKERKGKERKGKERKEVGGVQAPEGKGLAEVRLFLILSTFFLLFF